jgi:hypothetical protein
MMNPVSPIRPVEVDEYGLPLYPAGSVVPVGTYVRADRPWAPALVLQQAGILPATFDGHRVRYLREGSAPAGA